MTNTEEMSIEFTRQTLQSCFSQNYVVPDYQREYVWDEDPKKSQVEQLLSDIEEAYENNFNKQYFVGSIVVYKNGTTLEVIDGQQRLTTFFIFLCALYHLYKEKKQSNETIPKLIYSPSMDSEGNEKNAYHLELQYQDASNCLDKIYRQVPVDRKRLSKSETRLFNAYDKIIETVRDDYRDIKEFRRFTAFVLQKVLFVQIETKDMTDALKIFETINQRGAGLNPMDLLKNMIFMQVDRSKFKELNIEWKKITRSLESIDEKPLRFLRYYIMAIYDTSAEKDGILREDKIYQWLRDNNNQCHYEEAPFEFVRKMNIGVNEYVEYLRPSEGLHGNAHLRNISLLAGGSYKLHLMLLLASGNMSADALDKFKGILESIVYYATIARIKTNTLERTFAQWCPRVRQITDEASLDQFLKEAIIPAVNNWKKEYQPIFMSLGMDNIQQYRIRFILTRISRFVDIKRQSVGDPTEVTHDYMTKGVEIEHIMPQTISDVDMARYDITDRADYELMKNRLGNLVLLEKSLNASIHNDTYEEKAVEYRKSAFYLTRSLPKLVDAGNNTAINRMNKEMRAWAAWNRESIIERQQMLYNLAEKVWSLDNYLESK